MESNYIFEDFKKGKEYAFKYIYEKYYTLFRAFALKFFTGEHQVDDVVQECFIRLWEKRKTIDNIDIFKSYGYMTVRNVCLNTIRHENIKINYRNNVSIEEYIEESIQHKLIGAEVFQMVLEAFEELPEICRNVYRMSLNGMKHEDIATEMNIAVSTVKKHKNRANHFLRDRLSHLLSIILQIN